MKKTFRKITAMATALLTSACLMMPMTMSYTAFAANDGSITINNDVDGHTYEAYQIFSGTSSGNTLSNVQWGDGVNTGATLTNAIKAITINGGTPFANITDAASVAKILADNSSNEAYVKEFAKAVGGNLNSAKAASTSTLADGKYVISGLADGYYLVKDKDDELNGDSDAYTRYIVAVIDGAEPEISPKSALPNFEKQVLELNDTTGATGTWGDTADHDFNDEVEFKLTGTLPSNYDDYSAYKYVMHDKLSDGLTFKADSVVVKVGETPLVSGTDYNVVTTGLSDNYTFAISFPNLKSINTTSITKESEITVTYKATLDTDAVIGSTGNPNEAYLEYSNNPNDDGTDTGKTPEEKVVVFTYKTIINKIDSAGPLKGADFKLEKKVKDDNAEGGYRWDEVTSKSSVTADTTEFIFSGLDAGTYRLTETQTPSSYNTIEPIEFTISADTTIGQDGNGSITSLTGTGNGISFTPDTLTGAIEADVLNNKGSELPSTGGIGTTIFYVGGGALVAVAGVFLIAKKRMSSK